MLSELQNVNCILTPKRKLYIRPQANYQIKWQSSGDEHVKLKSVLMLAAVVIMWGSSFVVIKLGLEEIPPITLAFLRFLLVLPIFTVLTYFKQGNTLKGGILRDWKILVFLGSTGVTLGHVLQNVGLKFTTATNSSLIIASNPVFIALLAWMYLREQLSLRQILGIVLAFFGMAVVIAPQGPLRLSSDPLGLIGDLLSVGAAVSWALYTVLGKSALSKYDAITVTTFSMIFGITLLFPITVVLEGIPTFTPSLRTWIPLSFLSFLAIGIGYPFWFKALEDSPASQVGAFLFLIPLVSVLTAGLVLSEPFSPILGLGAVMVLLGTGLVEYG